MIKQQTFEILSLIEEGYHGFYVTQEKINAWHLVLANMEYEEVLSNLRQYMAENEYPPRPAHLTKGATSSSFVTPTSEETKQYLAKQRAHSRAAEEMPKEQLRAHLNQARAALGMRLL